jgi:predicted amino acid-binding ACT domain protein
MSNVDDGGSMMCDSKYFAEFRQRIKDGVISDKDLQEYAVRFGKNKASVKANLALFISDYQNKRISASDYILVNFVTKAALGIVTAVDIKAARKVWGGSLTGEDIQAVLTLNSDVQMSGAEVKDSSGDACAEDIEYLMNFWKKVKSSTICDNDLREYAGRFGESNRAIGSNFALVSSEFKKGRISASEYASLNFITKAALGTIGAADIKAARRAWGGALTGEDIQAVLDNNSSLEIALKAKANNGKDNQEYFTVFVQKVKNRTVDEHDMNEFASIFGKDKTGIIASVALVRAEYKKGGVSAAQYAVLNLIAKASLGMITATDIKAARRAWNGHLTGEDVQAVLAANNKTLETLSVEIKNIKNEMGNDEFMGLFRQKAKSGVVSDSDLKEYASRFGADEAKANLALISEEYKNGILSAAEYIALNLIMRAAHGNIFIADIRAARKVWAGGLTNEEVQVVLAANENSVQPKVVDQKESLAVEITDDATIMGKGKADQSDLNDKEYFAIFQQKVINMSCAENDLNEYAARFGKDTEFTKANLKIFAAQYKNRLISAAKYVELSFMAKAALNSVTEDDLEAVRGVWNGSLTDQEVEDVLAARSVCSGDIANEEASAALEEPSDQVISAEELSIAVEPAAEDSKEVQVDTAHLNDQEYFAFFRNKVIENCVDAQDFKEYARRFGKDPVTTRDNLRLFTMQYRNNLISGVKFAELNFVAKAALGIATALDMKAARSAWVGGLTLKDVQAILPPKNK